MNDEIGIWILIGLLVGVGIGCISSKIMLILFEDEIFDWIDSCQNWVRVRFGLK